MSICRDGVLPQDPGGSPLGDHGSDGRESARETGVRGVEGRRPRLRGAWTREAGKGPWPGPRRGQATTAPRQGPDPLALSFPLPPPRPLCRGSSRRWKGPSAHSHASVPCQVLNPELRGPARDPPCPPPIRAPCSRTLRMERQGSGEHVHASSPKTERNRPPPWTKGSCLPRKPRISNRPPPPARDPARDALCPGNFALGQKRWGGAGPTCAA